MFGRGACVKNLLKLARLGAMGLLLTLAGCVTTAEISLSQNDIAGMKLTGVTVSYAPDAFVQWEDGVRAYAVSKSIPDHEITERTNTPEAKDFVRSMLAPKIKGAIEKEMAGQLIGTRPVRLDIVVKRFQLPSAVQRVLIGGHRVMTADANLVDARSGAVIIANADLSAFLYAGQGIVGAAVQAAVDNASQEGVVEKLADIYGANYRNWLLRKA